MKLLYREETMSEPQPFISYLETLREDRGALAALRRDLEEHGWVADEADGKLAAALRPVEQDQNPPI